MLDPSCAEMTPAPFCFAPRHELFHAAQSYQETVPFQARYSIQADGEGAILTEGAALFRCLSYLLHPIRGILRAISRPN